MKRGRLDRDDFFRHKPLCSPLLFDIFYSLARMMDGKVGLMQAARERPRCAGLHRVVKRARGV
jgi:hypothetical protein